MGEQRFRPAGRPAGALIVPAVVVLLLAAGCSTVPPPQLQAAGGTPAASTPTPPPSGIASATSAAPDPLESTSPSAAPASSRSGLSPGTPATVPASPRVSSAAPSAAASGSAAPAVKTLALTSDLAHEILVAAATFNKLPVTAYSGLLPGSTSVGRDASGVTWAGAALQPSPASVPAQISVQDDGSYLLLRRRPGGDWTVWSVGLASRSDCARFGLPDALRTLWGWPDTGCHPAP